MAERVTARMAAFIPGASCFIEGCAHAVSFYGAVTKYFVPDNLRTAVTRHTKDELILQSTFADLEDFYTFKIAGIDISHLFCVTISYLQFLYSSEIMSIHLSKPNLLLLSVIV